MITCPSAMVHDYVIYSIFFKFEKYGWQEHYHPTNQ